MSTVVYDAAVLVAADRNERRTWAEHKARLELGVVPLVPAPVIAQVSRSPQQAQLRRFLTGCVVVPLGESEAHEAGRLLGMTRTADVVDAVVVTVALRRKAAILTSDPDDIERLVRASGREAELSRKRPSRRRQPAAPPAPLPLPGHGIALRTEPECDSQTLRQRLRRRPHGAAGEAEREAAPRGAASLQQRCRRCPWGSGRPSHPTGCESVDSGLSG